MKAIELGTIYKRTDRIVRRKLCYDADDKKNRLDPDKVMMYAKDLVARLNEDWSHSPMRKKMVIPDRGKQRSIDCPCLADHIVHWMLILAIKKTAHQRDVRS